MRLQHLSLALAGAAVGAAVLGALPAFGADHKDAPLSTGAAQSDITDLYAFKGASGGVVFVMNVNPLTAPADTAGLSLDPATSYQLKVDTNSDATADVTYTVMATGSGPIQDVTLTRATGSAAPVSIATGKTSAVTGVTTIPVTGGGSLFVGPRDDPFFFDLAAFKNNLQFTNPGVDTFKGTNITSIVLELPTPPAQKLGVWATTTKGGVQVDRMGRPAIATVFIGAAKKDAFNAAQPKDDVTAYKADLVAALASLGAGPGLADALLPDILTVDLAQSVKYLNGRGLVDDVIDISLQAITGNSAASDGVGANENAFLSTFPYLAGPNMPAAPAAPATGSGLQHSDGDELLRWTLPAGLIVAGLLLCAAGIAARRREERAEG